VELAEGDGERPDERAAGVRRAQHAAETAFSEASIRACAGLAG